jgi:hypothetical protein
MGASLILPASSGRISAKRQGNPAKLGLVSVSFESYEQDQMSANDRKKHKIGFVWSIWESNDTQKDVLSAFYWG